MAAATKVPGRAVLPAVGALTLPHFFLKWFPFFRLPLSCSTAFGVSAMHRFGGARLFQWTSRLLAVKLWTRRLLSVTYCALTQCNLWLHSVSNERRINPLFPFILRREIRSNIISHIRIAHPAFASTYVGQGWVVSAAAILFRGIPCAKVCAIMQWFPPGPGELHRIYGASLDRRSIIPPAARQRVTSPCREAAHAHLGFTSLSEVPVSASPIGGDDEAAGGVVDGAETLHVATPGLEHIQDQRTNKTSLIKNNHVQPHNYFLKSDACELSTDMGVDAPILGMRSMGLLSTTFGRSMCFHCGYGTSLLTILIVTLLIEPLLLLLFCDLPDIQGKRSMGLLSSIIGLSGYGRTLLTILIAAFASIIDTTAATGEHLLTILIEPLLLLGSCDLSDNCYSQPSSLELKWLRKITKAILTCTMTFLVRLMLHLRGGMQFFGKSCSGKKEGRTLSDYNMNKETLPSDKATGWAFLCNVCALLPEDGIQQFLIRIQRYPEVLSNYGFNRADGLVTSSVALHRCVHLGSMETRRYFGAAPAPISQSPADFCQDVYWQNHYHRRRSQ